MLSLNELERVRSRGSASTTTEAAAPTTNQLRQIIRSGRSCIDPEPTLQLGRAASETRSTNATATFRVAIYARSAMEYHAKPDANVSGQIARLAALCARRKLLVSGCYADPATSGQTANRAGLQKLLADAAADPRPFDLVLVTDFARISRSPTIRRSIEFSIRERGLILIAASFISGDG